MTMRVLVPLVFLAVLAAACGGGSSPQATPTAPATASRVTVVTAAPTTQAVIPFTPVEEVLTPPPDIDTSGWLTYRDDANGFELKYPPDGEVTRNAMEASAEARDAGTRINFPVVSGTELEHKLGFITVNQVSSAACVPSPALHPGSPDLALIHAQGSDFWSTWDMAGAAMHMWRHMLYMTSNGTTCVTLDAIFVGVSPSAGGVRTPIPTYDRETELDTFLAMLTTFRWTPH